MADQRRSILTVAAAALLLGGCSVNQSNPNLVAGKQAFVLKCGSCHTLRRAGTKGTTGPNLDRAFAEDVRENFGTSAIRGMVHGQIKDAATFPAGHTTTAMPKGLAHGQQADDIAAYVASVVSRRGKDTGLLATAVPTVGSAKPAVEKGGVLQIDADPNGQLAYVTKKATATAGTVTIAMANNSGTPHNLAIQEGTGATGTIVGKTAIVPKGTVKASVTLKPGTYTFLCQVPGHRAAGMFGTLTVK